MNDLDFRIMESSCDTSIAMVTSSPKKEQTKFPIFKVMKSGVKRGPRKLPKALQRPTRPNGMKSSVKIKANGLLDIKDTPYYLLAA